MQLELGVCFESLNDALSSAVNALGGNKKVGTKLRPELLADAAGNWLRDCMNTDRREKLSPEQVLLILRMARQAGFHAAMDWIAFDAGYEAKPVDIESQEAALQSKFIESVNRLASIQEQINVLQKMKGATK